MRVVRNRSAGTGLLGSLRNNGGPVAWATFPWRPSRVYVRRRGHLVLKDRKGRYWTVRVSLGKPVGIVPGGPLPISQAAVSCRRLRPCYESFGLQKHSSAAGADLGEKLPKPPKKRLQVGSKGWRRRLVPAPPDPPGTSHNHRRVTSRQKAGLTEALKKGGPRSKTRIGIGLGMGQAMRHPEPLETLIGEARRADGDGYQRLGSSMSRPLDVMTAAA